MTCSPPGPMSSKRTRKCFQPRRFRLSAALDLNIPARKTRKHGVSTDHRHRSLELSAALARDSQVQEVASVPDSAPAYDGSRRKKRRAMAFVMDGWRRWLGVNATE